jgi:hypothetical protein
MLNQLRYGNLHHRMPKLQTGSQKDKHLLSNIECGAPKVRDISWVPQFQILILITHTNPHIGVALVTKECHGSTVGIATSYGMDCWGSIPGRGKILLFSIAPGPIQPPIKRQPGVKRLGREADHTPPSSAKVKNVGTIPPLPHVFMAWCLIN